MKRRLLLLGCIVLALASACSVSSRDSNTRVGQGANPAAAQTVGPPSYDRTIAIQLDIASPAVRAWLNSQAWVHDASAASLTAVENIVSASYVSSTSERQNRDTAVMAVLGAIEHSDWHLSDDYVARLSAVFELLAAMDGAIGLGTRPSEYDWYALVASAIESGSVRSIRSTSGQSIQFMLAAGGAVHGVQDMLDVGVDQLTWIELHTRPLQRSVLVVLDGSLGSCGISFLQVVVLRPECGQEEVLAHELVHFAMPSVQGTWFTEGYAYLLAGMLAYGLTTAEIAAWDVETPFQVNGYYAPGRDYESDSREGMVFLASAIELAGFDWMTQAIGRIRDDSSGSQALKVLYETTPDEHREAMLELIRDRCVEVVGFGEPVACDPN